jgi:hypothetical protein
MKNNTTAVRLDKALIVVFSKDIPHFLPIQKCILAGETGLEPATPGFGDRCSTN